MPEDADNYLPKCTLCRRSLESLSIADNIPPFWQKVGYLLSLPFNRSSLILISVFAAVFSLLPFGKIGAILFLLGLLPLIEFFFAAMESVASGENLKLKVSDFLTAKSKSMFIKLMLIYAFSVILIVKLSAISSAIGVLLAGFLILGLPASIIILMMEKSMFSMVNPAKVGYIINLFGKAYFVLYAIILLASVIGVESFHMVESSSGFAKRFIVNWGLLYLTMVVFLMAGYLVYQYHRELNFAISRQTIFQVVDGPKAESMAEVNIMIQEGRFEDAQRMLLDKIKQSELDYKANEKLIMLYAIQGKLSFLDKIAQPYFEKMVKNGKARHAAEFYFKLHKKKVEFVPNSIDVVIGLTEEMKNKAQFIVALELIDRFNEKFNMVKGWEQLYFTRAQLLVEFANKLPEAKLSLQTILKRGIEQELLDKAEKYLKAFE